MNLLILSQIFAIFTVSYSFPSAIDLCKRKPYLLFCQEQTKEFVDSRAPSNQLPLPRPGTNFKHSANDNPSVHHNEPKPLITNAERNEVLHENPGLLVTPPVVNDNGPGARPTTPAGPTAKTTTGPIDMSRPNAEDVAREMGELQRDLPMEGKKSGRRLNENDAFIEDFDREDSDSSTTTEATVERFLEVSQNHSRHVRSSRNRRRDWVYLDDTDDLDYVAYRRQRARLLRKLSDLDNDQRSRHRYTDTDSYYYNSYPGYGSSYSSHLPSSYYGAGYPSYGYAPSYSNWNPGYLGGNSGYGGGYGSPFTFGIGSGLNIGLPYGNGVGVGTGLGVVVG
uniref:Secreted phosphoprotein 24 n=1 Tax=Panagrellus redivivus TaxID=6233 RepID=A0A7E4WA82_PANRE